MSRHIPPLWVYLARLLANQGQINPPWTWITVITTRIDTLEKPAIVLIHGAWHSASCWQLLVPLLASSGHEVFTPDLPGHGQNPAEMNKISLNSYSRYISQFIDNIGKKVILVGHSMAGAIISQVGENRPGQIHRLVYVSAYLPLDGQSIFDLISLFSHKDGNSPPIEEAMHFSDDKRSCTIPSDDIHRLFYNRSPGNRIPAAFPAQATLPLSGKVKITSENYGQLDKTYICCQDDRVIPVSDQRHMLSRQPCQEMIQLDCDHSPFVSCPELLASVLHSTSLEA